MYVGTPILVGLVFVRSSEWSKATRGESSVEETGKSKLCGAVFFFGRD